MMSKLFSVVTFTEKYSLGLNTCTDCSCIIVVGT